MPFVIGGLVLIVVVLAACLKVVPQANEFVIEFLGKYRSTWGAGLHFKIPFLERVAKRVTLKEQVLDSPPQPVITRDNVTMRIDSVVFWKIFDSKLFAYGAVNPIAALENLTITTLRNIVGDLDLDTTLTSRDTINSKLTQILDEATDAWGIKVTRVELKNIMPPEEIRTAMEKQMKAERSKREAMLQAEAHREASVTRARGDKEAMVLAAEGERDARIARAEGEAKALLLQKQAEADGLRAIMEANPTAAVLELKKYEALAKVAEGQATKIVIPSDVADMTSKNVLFSEMTGLGNYTEQGTPASGPAPRPDNCCDGNPNT